MISENAVLIHALCMGVYLSLVYDAFRIARNVCPHHSFFVALEDIAFWIYVSGEVFLFMDRETYGSLRWFAVLGGTLGIFLYEKTCSFFVVKYISLFISFLLKPIKRLVVGVRRIPNCKFFQRQAKK